MPMAPCKECEKELPADTQICPNCGDSPQGALEKTGPGVDPDNPVHIAGLLILGLLIIGLIFLAVKSCAP